MIEKTADEIRIIVQQHVDNVALVMGTDEKIEVPPPDEKDLSEFSGNWEMELPKLPSENVERRIRAVKELSQATYKLVR